MKKITGVLSMLIGAAFAASITLNVCFYRKFSEIKTPQAQSRTKIRKTSERNKSGQIQKKKASAPLILKHSGRYGHESIYIRFNSGYAKLVNLSPERISIHPAIPFTVSGDAWDHIIIKAAFQPETTYHVIIRKGLKTEDGKSLEYDAEFQLRFPALQTSIKAMSGGLIFPAKRTRRILPLELCNTDRIQIKVLKLYENNLLRFSAQTDWNGSIRALDYGKEIADTTIPVTIPRNKKVLYPLDFKQLIPDGKAGAYGLILTAAGDKKNNYTAAAQLLVNITDLAPQCVVDNQNKKVFAAIRRFSDGAPCPGAEITLVSSKFQILAKEIADSSGLVRLNYRENPAGSDPKDYPNALIVKYGGDIVFQQDLFYRGHSLAEFESSGNEVSSTPRALVYTERGVYRPGENIFVTAWVRNPDLKLTSSVPCIVKIRDPNWNVIYTRKLKTSPEGLLHSSFQLPEDMPGGQYTIWCQPADESCIWGQSGFIAADFMPDRIKVRLKPETVELFAGNAGVNFIFSANYYFGGKLEQAPYQFTVSAVPAAARPEWKEWTVGSREFKAGRTFSRNGKISAKTVKVSYPGFDSLEGKAYAPVALNAAVHVSEPGGRAVTAHSTVIAHPTPYYIGLRQQSENDQMILRWKFFPAEKNRTVTLKNQKIELSIVREEWKYVLKKNHAHFSREWMKEKIPVSREIIDSGNLAEGSWRKKLEDGRYEITARCGNMRTDIAFWHGYGEGGARSSNPAVIACTTDRKCYLPGDTAKVTLHSAADGFALIALGDLELASYMEYPVKRGRNELTLRLPESQTSACYGGITLIAGEQRCFGLVRFPLEQNRHRLKITMEAPETAMPRTKIKVRIRLATPDGQPQTGTVQLFAVDEGILALTEYSVPDIFKFFYGAYNCDFIFTDVYGLLYPNLKIDRNGRIGGDAKPETLLRFKNRRDLRNSAPLPAVAVLPPVFVEGSRELEISLPDHLGAMRLMAVASAPDRAGSAEKILQIRDKLDILPSVPQVCAPGDETEVTLTLLNLDLPDGKAQFELTLPDGKKITDEPMLRKGKQSVFRTRVRMPSKEGVCSFSVTLKKDGIVKQKQLQIPVRRPNPKITENHLYILKPGERWTPGNQGKTEFAADAEYTLTVSGSAAAALKDAVSWLNHYPYGCLEQTVSGAFPFLCADALEKCGVISAGMAQTAKIKANLAAAKILSMMLYNGSFPMWPGGTDEWSAGTVFAAHFLTANNSLRDQKQKKLISGYLKSLLQQASASRYERAYAGYVLAIMKRNEREFLTGIRNILKSEKDDFAAFIAAAALLEAGYSGEACPHLKRLLKKEIWRVDDSAPHFAGENARAGMTLYMLLKLQFDAPETIALLRHSLLNRIKSNGTGWGVTHDNAWAVLGLAELERRNSKEKSSASIMLPDRNPIKSDLVRNAEIKLNTPDGLTVENTGNTPVYIQYRIQGIPMKPVPVRGALRIQRSILRKGKAINSAAQGDLLTVRIQIECTGKVKDIVVSDLLPGGLEIEDERFATRAKRTASAPRKQTNLIVKQVEKRPGEFIISGDLRTRGKAEIIYHVRAVSRGTYATGSISAEAMYDPLTRAFEPGNGIFEVK